MAASPAVAAQTVFILRKKVRFLGSVTERNYALRAYCTSRMEVVRLEAPAGPTPVLP